MVRIAARHGWGATQVAYEWKVLKHESTSSPGHLNLWASNGYCFGSGQLKDPDPDSSGPAAAYRYYGGDYYTVAGQIRADLNYIVMHGYGTPEKAWEHELATGWY